MREFRRRRQIKIADATSKYAENAPPHLLWVKELLTVNMSETDTAAVQGRELAALEAAYRTPEHREAVAAFLEKRPARFR